MENITLYQTLYAFNGAEGKDLTEKIKYLDEEFRKIAEIILCKGYFKFGEKKVYIRDVEFYYHEENSEVKDPIMYHVNEKAPKNKKEKEKDRYKEKKYFEIGTFNFHISGVDLTFENKEKQYRASALIRGFCEDEAEGKYDGRSTYFYDYFDFVSPFGSNKSVKWVDDDSYCSKAEVKHTYRKNVPLYRKKPKKNEELCSDLKKEVVLRPDYMNEGRNAYEPIPYDDKYKNMIINKEGFEISVISTKTSKKVQDTIHQWRFYRNVDNIE